MTSETEDGLVPVGSLREVAAHAKREIDAGNMGRVLDLMAVSEEIGGEDGAQMVYANVILPRLKARWHAWLHDEPDAPELTGDELRMLLTLAIENADPEQLEQLMSLAERHPGDPGKPADEE
jgi:hypothetical protein